MVYSSCFRTGYFCPFLRFSSLPFYAQKNFYLVFYFVDKLDVFFWLILQIFWEQNFWVKCQARIYTAKSTNKSLLEQFYNFGLCWERNDRLWQISMKTAAERGGRGAFSRIIWKFFCHFFHSVLKHFIKNDRVLEVINIVQVGKFFQAKNLPIFSRFLTLRHLLSHFWANCRIWSC